jgi:hypothetical protein
MCVSPSALTHTRISQVICQARNLLNDDDVGGRNRTRLGRIEYTMRLAYELLEKEFDFRRCTNPVHGNMFVSRIQPLAEKIEKSKNNAQKLLLFLYEELGRLKYRRMHGCCYAQIYNKSGQATFAWKKVKTVEEFVYSYGDPNCAAYEFYSFGCGIPEMAIRRLLVDKSEYFPELKKNRYLFAYENGLADMFQFQFIPYDHCVIDNRVAVACRYIPTPFDPDWFDVRNLASIPTPEFNSVLEYQGLTDEVITIVKMFMGRCLYNLRTFDNWQAALYLVGLAGTGKSVVVETVGAFYEEDDVASFSNNIEKQFGLEKFLNKFVFVAPEIKSDMQLDPAQLQVRSYYGQVATAQCYMLIRTLYSSCSKARVSPSPRRIASPRTASGRCRASLPATSSSRARIAPVPCRYVVSFASLVRSLVHTSSHSAALRWSSLCAK